MIKGLLGLVVHHRGVDQRSDASDSWKTGWIPRRRFSLYRRQNIKKTIHSQSLPWGSQMRLVTVKLPKALVEGIDELIKAGFYQSRSAAIRTAVRELLRKELWNNS
jgi:hypothetical protein